MRHAITANNSNVWFSLAVLGFVSLACNAQCTSHTQLNKWERGQFAQAALASRAKITVQVLAERGCGNEVITDLRNLGAEIDYADNAVGYALFEIPKERLLDTLDIAGVAYAYTNNNPQTYDVVSTDTVPSGGRDLVAVPAIALPYPRVATSMSNNGPYFATDEIGLTELWRHHPLADGRGVRVGVVDEGFDLLHPALQQAFDASGQIISKVADIGTLTSLIEGSGWVKFGNPVHTKDRRFDSAGRTWTVEEDGTYRFGIFKQDLILGPADNSLSKKLPLAVGVLWDQEGNRIWVDTDGDGSFANERVLGDYGKTHEPGWFGSKRDGEDNRIPFGVKIYPLKDAIYVRIGNGHGTLVAGPLAANRLTGGLFTGAAPAAQLIDEEYSRKTRLAAIVKLAARPDVDVVNHSGSVGSAGYASGQEGMGGFEQNVLKRVIEVHKKPIVAYTAAPGAIHVMDYASSEMLRRNRQISGPYRDTINSSTLPLANGLVNLVLAPSANLVTQSRYAPIDLKWPDGKRHAFRDDEFDPPAPDGYSIGANPSPTIPVVSGVIADLISEAKRENIRYDATRLTNAIFTGAQLLEGFPVWMQGYGVVNAARSWEQMTKMAKVDDPENAVLTSLAISRTLNRRRIEVYGYDAEFHKLGIQHEGELWLTRIGGYPGPRSYRLSLRGNDGSFQLLTPQLSLERGKPELVRFRTTGASGRHTALLELRDTLADVIIQDVPLSVRLPDRPEKTDPGVDEYESSIQILRGERRYINCGEGVQATRYTMQIPSTGPSLCCSARTFPGFAWRDSNEPVGGRHDSPDHVGAMENLESLVANDGTDLRQIYWENRGRPEYATQYDGPSPDAPIHAKLTVRKYSVAITKTKDRKGANAVAIVNKLADVEGHVTFYDAQLETTRLYTNGKHASIELNRRLPDHLAQWRVRIAGLPKGMHADAFLFKCTAQSDCTLSSQEEITSKGTTLVVNHPEAGLWRIVLRNREGKPCLNSYKIKEARLVSTLLGPSQNDVLHRSGTKWTVPLPPTTQYAAFWIAKSLHPEYREDGLTIAMTPLKQEIP
jgi:hypothetical protein